MESTSQSLSANNSYLKLQDEEPTLTDNLELLDVSQVSLSDQTIDLRKVEEENKQPSQVEEEKELPKTMHPDFKEDEEKKQPSQVEKLSFSEKEELDKTMDEQISSKESNQIEEGRSSAQICKYGVYDWQPLPLKEELYRRQLCAIYGEEKDSKVIIIRNYNDKDTFHLELENSRFTPSIPGKYVAVFSSQENFKYLRRICAHMMILEGHHDPLSVFKKELDAISAKAQCSLNDLRWLTPADELYEKLSKEEINLIEDYKVIATTDKNNPINKIEVMMANMEKLLSLLDPKMESTVRDFMNRRRFDHLQFWATQQSEEIQKTVGEYIEIYKALSS